jgi:hypothetical protein
MTEPLRLGRNLVENPAVASIRVGEKKMEVLFIDGSRALVRRDMPDVENYALFQSFDPSHPLRRQCGWELCKSRKWVLDRLQGRAELAMTHFAHVRP